MVLYIPDMLELRPLSELITLLFASEIRSVIVDFTALQAVEVFDLIVLNAVEMLDFRLFTFVVTEDLIEDHTDCILLLIELRTEEILLLIDVMVLEIDDLIAFQAVLTCVLIVLSTVVIVDLIVFQTVVTVVLQAFHVVVNAVFTDDHEVLIFVLIAFRAFDTVVLSLPQTSEKKDDMPSQIFLNAEETFSKTDSQVVPNQEQIVSAIPRIISMAVWKIPVMPFQTPENISFTPVHA